MTPCQTCGGTGEDAIGSGPCDDCHEGDRDAWRPLMLDLFSGLGGASQAFRDAGWDVVTVDNDPAHAPSIVADLATYAYHGRTPTLVWASPPCTEFTRERLPWARTGKVPSIGLVVAAIEIIDACKPDYWVIENVRGAVPQIDMLLGRFTHRAGPFFLWSNLPEFKVTVDPFKERLSSRRSKERAKVPPEVSRAVLRAVESRLPWGPCSRWPIPVDK